MNLLQRVKEQRQRIVTPVTAKALSHRPDLAGRVHIYSSRNQNANTSLEDYADYAAVYGVYVWVRKAINEIAESITPLPLQVVNRDGEAIDGHPLTELFAYVNDTQSSVDLWHAYTVQMMLGGESFIELVPNNRGVPVEVWARRPDKVEIVPDASRPNYPTAAGYLYDGADDEPVPIEAEWMIHSKFYNPLNLWRGLAPIVAVREGITIDLFAQAWSKGFLKSGARPDFALVAPQGLTTTEKDAYLDQFLRDYSGNQHLPIVLEDGVTDIKTFSWAPKDIEWLEQRQFSRDEVGAIFGVPDEIMGYGKDTYENFQTALEVFWTGTLLPFTQRRDVVLTNHFRKRNALLKPGERIETDLSEVGVLQEDTMPKVDMAQKLFAMGVPFNVIDERLNLGIGAVEGGERGYVNLPAVPRIMPIDLVDDVVEQMLNPASGVSAPNLPAAAPEQQRSVKSLPAAPTPTEPPAKELKRFRKWARNRLTEHGHVHIDEFKSDAITRTDKLVTLWEVIADTVPVVKQFDDPEVMAYEEQLAALVQRARDGDISQPEFAEEIKRLAMLMILLMFLKGSGKSEMELTKEEMDIISENANIAIAAGEKLADDIYAGRFEEGEDGEPADLSAAQLGNRIFMWANVAAAMYAAGQLFRRDNPKYRWQVTPGKAHCTDCGNFSGQVKTAKEWQNYPPPRSRGLECGGWQCGCDLIEV